MMLEKKANNPLLALSYFLKGLILLLSKDLRSFLLMPLFINFVLYMIALLLGYHYLNDLINQSIPTWLHWLRWLLWPLFFISFFISGFFTFTVLANMLAAPFYGRLSAKTLKLITGQVDVIVEQPMAKVMAAEFKRVAYLASRAIPLLILFVIPGINLIAPFLWGVFGAWGMALEYFAYPLENQGVLFAQQKELVQQIRFGALTFGGMTMFGLTLPIINIVIAPAAVIGATIYIHEMNKN